MKMRELLVGTLEKIISIIFCKKGNRKNELVVRPGIFLVLLITIDRWWGVAVKEMLDHVVFLGRPELTPGAFQGLVFTKARSQTELYSVNFLLSQG